MNCNICMNKIINKRTLDCKHVFCKKCIDKWLFINNKCPNCRAVILKPIHRYNLRSRNITNLSTLSHPLELDLLDDGFIHSRITRADSKCHRFSLFVSECKVYLKEINIARQNNASINEKLTIIDKLMKLIDYNLGCIPTRLKNIIFDKLDELSNDHNIEVSTKMNYWKMKIIS